MALCPCNGCAGHEQWKREQEAELEAKRADFEAWLAAGKPSMTDWTAMKAANGDRSYMEMTVAEAEALAIKSGAA